MKLCNCDHNQTNTQNEDVRSIIGYTYNTLFAQYDSIRTLNDSPGHYDITDLWPRPQRPRPPQQQWHCCHGRQSRPLLSNQEAGTGLERRTHGCSLLKSTLKSLVKQEMNMNMLVNIKETKRNRVKHTEHSQLISVGLCQVALHKHSQCVYVRFMCVCVWQNLIAEKHQTVQH